MRREVLRKQNGRSFVHSNYPTTVGEGYKLHGVYSNVSFDFGALVQIDFRRCLRRRWLEIRYFSASYEEFQCSLLADAYFSLVHQDNFQEYIESFNLLQIPALIGSIPSYSAEKISV